MQKTGTVFRGKAKIIPPDTFFLPYQKRWIEDESRLKLMEKGRQIGLSLSTAYRCVEKCAAAGNRNDIWVSSRDDLQAKLLSKTANALPTLFRRHTALSARKSATAKQTTPPTFCVLQTGAKYTRFPQTPMRRPASVARAFSTNSRCTPIRASSTA